jgi:hypothetical protein
MNGAFDFDWRGALALTGIITAGLLLIAYQRRGKNAGEWLGYAALSLELLGLALSLYWAANAPAGAVMPIVFCIGWIGMLIGRAVSIPFCVKAAQTHHWPALSFALAGLMLAYAALYGSGLFHAINDAGNEAAARLEQSKPAQALDSEIEATRAKIAGLAGFSDAGKAAQVETDLKAQAQAAAAQAQAASQAAAAEIAAARAALDAAKIAAAYMQPDCTPKKDGRGQPFTSKAAAACEAVRAAAAAVEDAKGAARGNMPAQPGGGDSYLSRHAEYNGLQSHLITLQNQRAALSASGGAAVVSAWKPEDVALADWFNTTPEKASRFKWLLATLIFDILSLIFRILAALAGNDDPAREARRRFAALLSAGLSTEAAAAMLAGSATAPATPAPETPAPATPAPETPAPATPAPETPAPATPAPETPAPATPAPKSGISDRTKAALTKINRENPGLFNRIGVPGLSRIRSWLDAGAQFNDKPKFGLCKKFHCFELPAPASLYCKKCAAAEMAATPAAATPSIMERLQGLQGMPAGAMGFAATQRQAQPAAQHAGAWDYPTKPEKPATSQPSASSGAKFERVPADLSGKRGTGRKGKMDTCLHCGADYLVKAWTQVCCNPDCTAKLAGYADNEARRTAFRAGGKRR